MQNFVFLPDRSSPDLGATVLALSAGAEDVGVLGAVSQAVWDEAGEKPSLVRPKIIDFVPESGAARVELDIGRDDVPPEVVGGKYYPIVYYEPAIATTKIGRRIDRLNSGPAAAKFFTLKIIDSVTGDPVAGSVVQVRPLGASAAYSGVSDRLGVVKFGFRAAFARRAVALVEPGFLGNWGFLNRRIDLNSGDTIAVEPIDPTVIRDGLRQLMNEGGPTDGHGVVVGVVDTGVGPHPDLPNASGDEDTSLGHGSHVAGIIAGRGNDGLAGIAPGAEIRSYRVFEDSATGVAANFDIHKAIERAVSDGCHLVNLSLKIENLFTEIVVGRAVEDATDAGALVVAAAGNDFRKRVAFPARHADAISVSACGYESGLPETAYDRWTLSKDRGSPDDMVFFANFSNEGIDGTHVDIVAPGAGVVSTVPGDQYAPMSGTSMACPAAVGAIARILGANPEILQMDANRQRRDAMWAMAQTAIGSLGLGQTREGRGMIG